MPSLGSYHIPSQSSGLTTLPTEIRFRILKFLAHAKQFHSLAALAGSSYALYNEAIHFIYENAHFDSVGSYTALARALAAEAQLVSPVAAEDGKAKHRIKTLRENFGSTKKVTLGDLPDRHQVMMQVSLALGNAGAGNNSRKSKASTVLLCPNADLLLIAPLRPYLTMSEPTGIIDSSPHKSPPPFLSQLCVPKQICFMNVFGSYAELRSDTLGISIPSFESFLGCLKAALWPAKGMEVSWHGPLLSRYGHGGGFTTGVTFGKAKRIRLYLPSDLDIKAMRVDDGLAELWAGSVLSDLQHHIKAKQNGVTVYAINVTGIGPEDARVRLRSRPQPIFGERVRMGKTVRTARLAVSAIEAETTRSSIQIDGFSNCLVTEIDEFGMEVYEAGLRDGTRRVASEDKKVQAMLSRVQNMLDKTADTLPPLDRDDILAVLLDTHETDHRQIWRIETNASGEKSCSDVTVRVGREQEICPVCDFCPY